jgi:Putative lactococcus lactis phage r1t holin
MLSKLFWADALERAVKTFAQSALATLGLGSVDVLSTNWVGVLSVGAGAAVVSILTSVASEPRSGTLSPASVVKV